MVISVGGTASRDCMWNIGTHNGIFHCDEVVGTAIFKMVHRYSTVHVVRTRNPEELKMLDIVIDIGGGEFDHHMAGFDLRRPTGEKYASAGLVWKEFAEKVIESVAIAEEMHITNDEVQTIKAEIDREIIALVDMEDNGEGMSNHTFSFIPKFLPTWHDTPDYDEAFGRVTIIVVDILEEIIKDKVAKAAAKRELQRRYDCINDGILEIPAQTMPWLEEVVNYNHDHNNSIKFVIFPYPAGGWAAQSVPPSIERKFEQLVPFPKEWAGATEENLPTISGIVDAILCHNGRFFARAKNKEAIISMCRIAMNK